MIAIGFVDIEKGREDCRRFVEARKVERVQADGSNGNGNENGNGNGVLRGGIR